MNGGLFTQSYNPAIFMLRPVCEKAQDKPDTGNQCDPPPSLLVGGRATPRTMTLVDVGITGRTAAIWHCRRDCEKAQDEPDTGNRCDPPPSLLLRGRTTPRTMTLVDVNIVGRMVEPCTLAI